ncbi:Transmembrane protein 199 [Habropoda laboriosa]|uniref:Transmembrane protein 199 n=1 Tax=Habropoda laboriosa TaxID=597456 RepID=A0A0L7QSA2_9HYME|nr:PREDICTED: transmembrane protein 199 [Habropoda laboriosa]KOC61361.1 Transmembrane protein 199 [Habropoda laboriosa]
MPVESIEDPSIKIKPNKKLIEFICKNIKKTSSTTPTIAALKKSTKEKQKDILLNLEDLKWLKNYLENYRILNKENIYLHELLEEDDIRLPTPKVTPRNPELEARTQKLKAQQDAIRYRAMTKNVDNTVMKLPEDTISYQMKQINKQLIAVAQFVFSVLAGFAFGFIGVELIVGNLDFGFRLLLGIICALIIALAEIYFLAIKLNEDVYDAVSTPAPKKLHQE